ncbi:MAG: carbon-nitrogen hydrolase family protein [Roseovarius sp.]
MSDRLNLALLQSPADLEGQAARLTWLEARLQELAPASPDIVVLPELFQCGYNVAARLSAAGETRDGAFAQAVAALARAQDTAIVYGCAERDGDALYNAALAFGRDGRMLGHHRKLLLPPGFEGEHFAPGEGSVLFGIGAFKVALLVCYDVEFPETVRHVAMAGADLVIVPTALSDQWPLVADKLVPVRAFENGVFLAYCNHSGTENGLTYHGGSCIVAPDGADLARAGAAPQSLSATLDHAAVARARARLPYHRDRAALPWVMTGG